MMTFVWPSPILAADFGTLISVVFLVIAFLGWIMNAIGGNQQQPQQPPRRGPGGPPRRPPRPRDERLQNEIDVFLQEVGGRRREEPVPIEVVEEREERRPRPQPRPRQQPVRTEEQFRERSRSTTASASGSQKPPAPRKTSSGVHQRPIGSDRGDRLRDERETRSEEPRLAQFAEEPVAEQVVSSAAGAAAAPRNVPFGSQQPVRSSAAAALMGLLRDPVGVRQAILVNEVLSKPKALRDR